MSIFFCPTSADEKDHIFSVGRKKAKKKDLSIWLRDVRIHDLNIEEDKIFVSLNSITKDIKNQKKIKLATKLW